MIRVQDIKLSVEQNKDMLIYKIAKKLHVQPSDVITYTIFKEAIDARKKDNIQFVYTIDVKTKKDNIILKKFPDMKAPNMKYIPPPSNISGSKKRPVIVGTGPCGLFAGLILAEAGYNPILIERGKKVDERIEDINKFWEERKFNKESNVQFGEGGAGTFSDGKLTTQIKNTRCRKVLEELVNAGANENILYKNKPHIGTDILRSVVKNIRIRIETLGGTFRFNTCLTNIKVNDNKLVQIEVNNKEWIDVDTCILALGHSARDTFNMLYNSNLNMEQKPFSIGMRIEHLQSWINKAQYGEKFAKNEKLGAADYKLVHHCKNGKTVYSFCMCPGGEVIVASSEEGHIVTNGMSEYDRDNENANSALLINVSTDDFGSDNPLAGIDLQRKYEKLAYVLGGNNYDAPIQTLGDFLNNVETTDLGEVKPTYAPNTKYVNLRNYLPLDMSEAFEEAIYEFDKKIENFGNKDAILTGFETRSSSPLRLSRDSNYESNIKGIYPAGEGAGYAGGIMSSAVDGIVIAEKIIERMTV
ncbi:hypothetical protein AN639_06735 [Candidatus Epulonipiscium fishelsonii]|uniref:Uncharacterized protein n=1 Tax=Candidatus Epulonipiscium fishelsonii TaxID=77094 RepID=A0ACC8XGY5_9FIRM|nr:hypothetical protein AN639_06735 [Epulopiscium sp. SCG-B05WGA-EpuloA1]ONI42769.1 hypothetical protein AN396_13295 [Epulopiscium sp. SCG-B11WGA-EpuloA1]